MKKANLTIKPYALKEIIRKINSSLLFLTICIVYSPNLKSQTSCGDTAISCESYNALLRRKCSQYYVEFRTFEQRNDNNRTFVNLNKDFYDSVPKEIDSIKRANDSLTSLNHQRVGFISSNTYSKFLTNEWSKLSFGDAALAQGRRFATLNLDGETGEFTVSPLNMISKNRKFILGTLMQGELSDIGELNFANKKTITFGLSGTFNILPLIIFKVNGRLTPLMFKEKVFEYADCIMPKYRLDCEYKCDSIVSYNLLLNPDKGLDAYVKDISDYEIELLKNFKKIKSFTWINTNVNFFKWSNFNYIDIITLTSATLEKPKSVSLYSPDVKLTLNEYLEWQYCGWSWGLYVAPWISAGYKNVISPFNEKNTWNKFVTYNDSISLLNDQSDFYIVNSSQFTRKVLVDGGIISYLMFDVYNKLQFGLGWNYFSENYMNLDNSTWNRRTSSMSLVIPFKKPDGETTFNIEIFYKSVKNRLSTLSDEQYGGIKFGLPIGN